jgi:cystathionine beta-lyase
VADEIHGDLIFSGNEFTPFASLGQKFSENSISCTSASKTFNLAGLHTSCIVIEDQDNRTRFNERIVSNGLFGSGPFGLVALKAAYDHGEQWLGQALAYIEGNLDHLEGYVSDEIPQLTVIRPEGTYLVWLDCRRLGLGKMELKKFMLEEAGVYLDEGFIFGPEGEGFERINIACPRPILEQALDRIRRAVQNLTDTPLE